MQKKYSLLFFLFCSSIFVYGQYENVWVFGSGLKVDFNSGTPIPGTTSIRYGDESAASVCDANGKSLFYTGGSTAWGNVYDTLLNDYVYDTLVNGSNLADSVYEFVTTTTTQGALIVPMPDSADKYYIFSLTAVDMQLNKTWGNLYYSVVKMDTKQHSGLGSVDSNRKRILVDSNLQEKMISVVGDRCNIWVLTCGADGRFRAYEITSSGVNTTPVISSVKFGSGYAPAGMLAVSPDRTKIAAAQYHAAYGDLNYPDRSGAQYGDAAVALFDFDASSGVVSNPVTLFPYVTVDTSYPAKSMFTDSIGYAVCFSPNGTKLYCTMGFNGAQLCQFDLSSGNPVVMANSRTTVGIARLSQLKAGPDGKIYFYSNAHPVSLGCIASPNLAGAACQVIPNSITFDSGTSLSIGLPNVISLFKRDTMYSVHTVVDCDVDSMWVSATDTSGWDYIWDDGSYGEKRAFSTSGTYLLRYHTSPCVFHTDTFIVRLPNLAPIINVNRFKLSTTLSYDTYQWYLNGSVIPGATDSVYVVTENGDYTVMVSDTESGCTATSAIYKVNNVTGINSLEGLWTQIKIYPNPTSNEVHFQSPMAIDINLSSIEGRLIRKIENAQVIDVKNLAEGVYLIHVYDQNGRLLKIEKIIKI